MFLVLSWKFEISRHLFKNPKLKLMASFFPAITRWTYTWLGPWALSRKSQIHLPSCDHSPWHCSSLYETSFSTLQHIIAKFESIWRSAEPARLKQYYWEITTRQTGSRRRKKLIDTVIQLKEQDFTLFAPSYVMIKTTDLN